MLGFASLADIAGLAQGSFPEASANALEKVSWKEMPFTGNCVSRKGMVLIE